VARRLGAESAGLVFGAQVPTDDMAGLPELEVGGLRRSDARALLDLALAGPIEARVRTRSCPRGSCASRLGSLTMSPADRALASGTQRFFSLMGGSP
jgi:hypothetical protein